MCTVDKTSEARPTAPRRTRMPMTVIVSALLACAATATLAPQTSCAQGRGNASDNANQAAEDEVVTLEGLAGRVAALERMVARIDNRLSVVQDAVRPPPEPDARPAALRIDDLERQIAQLRLDLQRVQTSVESAARTADNAQRSATQAENTARDALFRASQ